MIIITYNFRLHYPLLALMNIIQDIKMTIQNKSSNMWYRIWWSAFQILWSRSGYKLFYLSLKIQWHTEECTDIAYWKI